jgi:hypothetical protein
MTQINDATEGIGSTTDNSGSVSLGYICPGRWIPNASWNASPNFVTG